jgi:hypothetical protein
LSSLALFIRLKSRYLASFSSVAKAKAKAYFLKRRSGFLFRCHAQCNKIWLPFPALSLLALFIGLKSRILASFSGVAKAKAYFLKNRDLASFSGVAKAKVKLIFLKSRSGFGTKNLASFSSVALIRPV